MPETHEPGPAVKERGTGTEEVEKTWMPSETASRETMGEAGEAKALARGSEPCAQEGGLGRLEDSLEKAGS